MKHIMVFIVFAFFAGVQVKAKGVDFDEVRGDSVRGYPRFRLAKPYIGWEGPGPSKYLALSYQQEIMQLNKFSFLDLQVLMNNSNILGIIDDPLTYDGDNYYTRTHKFAMFLIERNKIFKSLSVSCGLGYIFYQGFEIWYREKIVKKSLYAFLIFRGTLTYNVSRNFLINLSANYVFTSEDNKIRYLDIWEPINFSVGLQFGFNKKKEESNREERFKRNEIFFNFTKLQLGYERFLLDGRDYNVSMSIGGTTIPFRRFGEYSYKVGWFTLVDGMVNFDVRLKRKLYSFVGVGGTLNNVSYYVLNDKYSKITYGLRSQIGLSFKLSDHVGFKLFYAPYIVKYFNVNIERMNSFLFLREYRLNLSMYYSFGK